MSEKRAGDKIPSSLFLLVCIMKIAVFFALQERNIYNRRCQPAVIDILPPLGQ